MTSHKKGCEREFDFTLILEGIQDIDESVEKALFEAGCDDSTVSMRFGRVYMTFSRTAESLKDAIVSAIQNVRRSGVNATVLRVDTCDLVTPADIARRIGRTRQMIHLYIGGKRGPGGFPAPACNITKGYPLWHWREVAYWLHQNNLIRDDEYYDAQDVSVINNVLALEHQRRIEPELTKEISESLCLFG